VNVYKVMLWNVAHTEASDCWNVMKILERDVEARVRRTVEIEDMQFGFMAGK